ncbi:GH3 auxin-responsive promoter family protein [Rivularia sp. UHCC 0363]|uniref:GH3 auxin-responsive promoter family protein n=1 Tax=Rivularia sp. UHCC 0363 TaxID=3110244 RepID=UPI002B21DA43|nr:GH3 auxin-responsive promoter family protein [Rivularia sp. UHCC 0363]MEA5597730.1 GH3 auxin-responsive promoter family protein [Rivularia sp. UHCC 0363]
MTSLSSSLLTAYATYHKVRFARKTLQVYSVQERFLLNLLQAHKNTEMGKKLGLSTIKTIEQFREQVPILPYESYAPYVDRISKGEKNVLNPEPVIYINLTSGSTGNKKQVPVTRSFQASLRRADLASMGFALKLLQQRGLKFGKVLLPNSANLQGITSGGIPYGPVSVGSIRKGQFLFEQIFVYPFAALKIADSLARHYVCLLFALRNRDLRGFTANFPMLVLRTCGYLEDYAEDLINDLETGAIASWLKLEPHIRVSLERKLLPVPGRAAELREILKTEGKLTPKQAWSGLSYVLTAQGGTSDFYLQHFPHYFGDTPVFGGVYGSAEATFSVYHNFNSEAGILAVESGFFEFIPQEQWEVENPKTLLATEVEIHKLYRILVTSYSGFYRYDIGDVVEVLGFYNQAPLIAFRYRRGGLLSSTTEKTTECHVIQVMEALHKEFNLRLDDFCITLSEQEFPAHYIVNIELAAGETLSNPQGFLNRFEYWLTQINTPYGTVRDGQVPSPRLRILQAGSFDLVRQRQIKRGMPDSQLKLPHISEDRSFLAELTVEYEVNLSNEYVNQIPDSLVF